MRTPEKSNGSSQYSVLTDIISGKGKTYALKGDQVILIATYGDVLIVEKNGDRFPIRNDKISKI